MEVIVMMMAIVVCAVAADGDPARPEYFTAAIFESTYAHDSSAHAKDDIIPANLNAYKRAATAAASKGADIIVFSEYGLFPYKKNRTMLTSFTEHVPDPQMRKTNPCDESDEYRDRPTLHTLSCMAKHNRMYVVANMGDQQPCEERHSDTEPNPCPENGKRIYNTDVAFDRDGNLVARYHKNHLYFEMMNTPKPYEMVSFDTEFGRMGLIVCFDSMFKEAIDLVEKQGIDTMIFPTYWFDDIVPLNGIEWQQSWALANGVNFIAANTNHPQTGSLGSGIYSKTFGAMTYTYNPDGKSRLLVARVPLGEVLPEQDSSSRFVIDEDGTHEERDGDGSGFPSQCQVTHLADINTLLDPTDEGMSYRCFKEQYSKYALVKLDEPKGRVSACHAGTCCTVTYSADSMDEDYYLAVFNGTNDVRSYYHWAEEDCFVVRCDPDKDGRRPCAATSSTAKTVFDFVEIRATFSESARVYPTVSKKNFRLAPKSEYDVETDGTETVLTFRGESDAPLLKAGMMARVYQRDPPFVPFYKYF